MVYVHVPFCRSFCTYCDFYSEISCKGREKEDFGRFADLVCKEIRARREEIAGTLDTNTLYFGGGTPSVLPPEVFGRIVRELETSVPGWTAPEEFTVEVNPDDITEKGAGYVGALMELGVNRFSMGVQSMDPGMLEWMNRRHNPEGAEKAFWTLRGAGAENISLDVIFGVGGMDEAMLESTLDKLISWNPEHLSAYQLSIEEGSALGKMAENGRYTELDEESCAAQYKQLCRKLSEAGYRHYEISNWARPGHEARHNSAYWSRKPYVGLGPGAHSLGYSGENSGKPDMRSWNSQELSGWKRERELLGPEEIKEEEIMLGLRTAEGWNGKRIAEDQWFGSDEIILEAAMQSAS